MPLTLRIRLGTYEIVPPLGARGPATTRPLLSARDSVHAAVAKAIMEAMR
jgi:hypothetical protein